MRLLKNYLKSTIKKDKIPKSNFKFYLTNYGIFLTDPEMDLIYSLYDEKNKDEINFTSFLDSLIVKIH